MVQQRHLGVQAGQLSWVSGDGQLLCAVDVHFDSLRLSS